MLWFTQDIHSSFSNFLCVSSQPTTDTIPGVLRRNRLDMVVNITMPEAEVEGPKLPDPPWLRSELRCLLGLKTWGWGGQSKGRGVVHTRPQSKQPERGIGHERFK